MALNLFHSNMLEALLTVLNQQLKHSTSHPLFSFKVLTQSPGMAHWVKLQLAQQNGIVANIDFPLPVKTLLDILERLYPHEGKKLSPESLQWMMLDVLNNTSDSSTEAATSQISQYVHSNKALTHWRKYQLAIQLGSLYDQYMTYRPDWLASWEQNTTPAQLTHFSDEQWQGEYWRFIKTQCEHYDISATRNELIHQFINQPLASSQIELLQDMFPNGLHLFGLSVLPPLYMQFFYALSQYIEVSMYLLNPSPHYWADTVDEKYKAKLNLYWQKRGAGSVDQYYGVGNPLLSSWGIQGKQFQRLLYDMLPEDGANVVDEHRFFIPQQANSLLAHIQADMYHLLPSESLEKETITLPDNDRSLQIHDCHSRMREVQVLFDYLLKQFNHDTNLHPKDVIVLTPNIEDYAHYIDAVFGMGYQQGQVKFPYSISDRKPVDSVPEFQALMMLLRFDDYTFDYQVILQLLNVESIAKTFGFTPLDMNEIAEWVKLASIRRGLSKSAHVVKENTWSQGLKRMLVGAVLGDEKIFDEESLTLSVAVGKQTEKLGQLCELIDRLAKWSVVLVEEKTLADWISQTFGLFTQFFLSDEDVPAIERLRTLLSQHKDAIITPNDVSPTLTFREYADYIQRLLAENQWGQRFLVGAVNFCSMVPMRSIPFKIVCMLGMNDKQFPRQQFPPSFDLVAKAPKLGDYNKKAEDKTIFLESILSARDKLFISYVGRSIQDNSVKEPSVLLSELQEYIAKRFELKGAEENVLAHITHVHALQPYDTRYFTKAENKFYSFNDVFYTDTKQPPLESNECNDEVVHEFSCEQFIQAIVEPIHYAYQYTLGATFSTFNRSDEPTEPFEVSKLVQSSIRETVLKPQTESTGYSALQTMRLKGNLPQGEVGNIVLSDLFASGTWQTYQAAAEASQGREKTQARIDLSLKLGQEEIHISGVIPNFSETGLDLVSHQKKHIKHDLIFWLQHVLVCAQTERSDAFQSTSFHYGDSDEKQYARYTKQEALSVLSALASRVLEAQAKFLPFEPTLSEAYYKAFSKQKDKSAGLVKVESLLKSDFGIQALSFKSIDVHKMCFPEGIHLQKDFHALTVSLFEVYEACLITTKGKKKSPSKAEAQS